MIVISMDLDWASDEVLADSLLLLEQAGIRATFFLTHKPELSLEEHEVGIHPHFATLALEAHLLERTALIPDAIGTRSHALFDTYRLQNLYAQAGIRYQSDVVQYLQPNLEPYKICPWVTEVPIYFMDNIDILMRGGNSVSRMGDLKLGTPGLKVFDFHPIHVYLNTDSLDRYEAAKPFQADMDRLATMRNTTRYGVRNQFIDVLQRAAASNDSCPLMREVGDRGL